MFSFFSTTIETNLFIFIFLDILYIFYEFIFSFIPYSQKDNVRLNCDTILSPFNIFQRSLNQFQYKILLLERNYATLCFSQQSNKYKDQNDHKSKGEEEEEEKKFNFKAKSPKKKRGKEKKNIHSKIYLNS